MKKLNNVKAGDAIVYQTYTAGIGNRYAKVTNVTENYIVVDVDGVDEVFKKDTGWGFSKENMRIIERIDA